jgi:hypothetical protein
MATEAQQRETKALPLHEQVSRMILSELENAKVCFENRDMVNFNHSKNRATILQASLIIANAIAERGDDGNQNR